MTKRKRKTKSKKKVVNNEFTPDYKSPCMLCDAIPTVPATGMCGPCTFGEADTTDGNW
jgi:hypothetical protein